ncbi:MAG: cytochrome d ubiquinol oxidase subunit II [Deltaproteobacteria bacterium]|nr:cytochrome d ubiquinol oxidase subunit II [Deltaproteobacteria bacterium]
METLQIVWFVLVAVLLAGYAVLDGFDLGVGALYPFLGKTADEQRVLRHSIGPVWDANEVWLLTGGGALFAAFPPVYATVFSGFYLALMLVLFALIFRAVSLEFAGHDPAWAPLWNVAFFAGSALPALLFGVAAGNIHRGVPLAAGEYAGTFFTLLNPYALLCGAMSLALFVAHGAAWTTLKTEGALRERAAAVRSATAWVALSLVLAATAATAVAAPERFRAVLTAPLGWALVALLALAFGWARLSMKDPARDRHAFYGSALVLASLVGIGAVGQFPMLLPALGAPEASLTAFNSSSSTLTLTVMLIVAAVGMPIVLVYKTIVYRAFAGRLSLGEGGPY